MDIEKLIEGLKKSCWGKSAHVVDDERRKAADALSTLQAENDKLRAEVESLQKEHCAGCSIPAVKAEQIRDLTDAPKLRAELEQVKQERDEAVECVNTVYSYILIKSKTDAVLTIEKWLRGQKED